MPTAIPTPVNSAPTTAEPAATTATSASTPANVAASVTSALDPAFDLSTLTIEAIPAERNPELHLAHQNPGPYHKYDQLIVRGFKRQLSTDEIVRHPLIILLHDFKHLMLHGDRGTGATRRDKRKRREPYENHYCRLGFVYLVTQNSSTHDLNIGFIIDTAFHPVWTEYDGTPKGPMSAEEIVTTVDNFIDSYLAEAQTLLAGDPLCEIEAKLQTAP